MIAPAIVIIRTEEQIPNDICLNILSNEDHVFMIERKGFSGTDGYVEIMITLISSVTTPIITYYIAKLLKSKKGISIKIKGIEIDGLSKEQIEDILKKVSKSIRK